MEKADYYPTREELVQYRIAEVLRTFPNFKKLKDHLENCGYGGEEVLKTLHIKRKSLLADLDNALSRNIAPEEISEVREKLLREINNVDYDNGILLNTENQKN